VPIRYVIEAAGGDVGWNEQTKIVSLKINDTNVSLSPVSSRVTIDGSTNQTNNTPILEKGQPLLQLKILYRCFQVIARGTILFHSKTAYQGI